MRVTPESGRARRGLAAALLLAASVSAALLVAVWTLPTDGLVRRFLWDDSFYYLQTARNVVGAGICSFDGRNPTNGFHPLWMIVLLPLCAFLGNDPERILRGALTLQIVAFLLPSLALAYWVSRRWFGSVAAFAALAAALVLFPSRQVDGMEAGVLILLGLLLVLHLAGRDPFAREGRLAPRLLAGLLLGLLFLGRTDSVFLVAAWFMVAGWMGWREPRVEPTVRRAATSLAHLLPTLLVLLLLAVPYLAWNWSTFGSFIPISGAIKYGFANPARPGQSIPTVTALMMVVILAAWLLDVRSLLRPRGSGASLRGHEVCFAVLGLHVIAHSSFTVLKAKWGISPWHFSLYAVPFVLAVARVAAATERLARRWIGEPWGGRLGATACLVLVGFALAKGVWRYGREFEAFTGASLRAALWSREHLPREARIGMKDCGAFGYFSNHSVTNLDGIINNFDYQRYLAQGLLAGYLQDQGIAYLAQHALTRYPAATTAGYDSIVYSIPIYPRGGDVTLWEDDEVYRASWDRDADAQFVIWRLRRGPSGLAAGPAHLQSPAATKAAQ